MNKGYHWNENKKYINPTREKNCLEICKNTLFIRLFSNYRIAEIPFGCRRYTGQIYKDHDISLYG